MSTKSVYIFGAGGHCRSVISLINDTGITAAGIYDNSYNPNAEELIISVPVLGSFSNYQSDKKIVLAVGNNDERKALYASHSESVFPAAIVHPTAYVGSEVVLGRASLVFAKAVLNTNAGVGANTIINTGAIVEHEVQIGTDSHISVGAIICGRASIGNLCFIGAGAVVIDKVRICDGVTVGANSVVIDSIDVPGTYVGNPAKRIK